MEKKTDSEGMLEGVAKSNLVGIFRFRFLGKLSRVGFIFGVEKKLFSLSLSFLMSLVTVSATVILSSSNNHFCTFFYHFLTLKLSQAVFFFSNFFFMFFFF